MSQKKCPHCGVFVRSNSLTCPKCFKEIPGENTVSREYTINEDKKEKKRKVPLTAVALAIIPAFFGLLGLGLIYLDHKNKSRYWFLAVGLALFLPMLALLYIITRSGLFSAILLSVGLLILSIIYISAAVAALLETLRGSVLEFLKF